MPRLAVLTAASDLKKAAGLNNTLHKSSHTVKNPYSWATEAEGLKTDPSEKAVCAEIPAKLAGTKWVYDSGLLCC